MALLPSRKVFDLPAPPLASAPAPASFGQVFIIGTLAILANAALALAIVVSGELTPWIAVPFLAGLVPAAILARRCQAAAGLILFITALPAGGIALLVDIAPVGRVVDLAGTGSVPDDLDVAAYAAPSWHIETDHKAESSMTVRRGRIIGRRTVAPLVSAGWTAGQPVAIWIVGYVYQSGKIGPRHPAHWTEPGEYPRLVGSDLSEARIAVNDAAAAQGLTNTPDPMIVVHADNADAAMAEQAIRLAEMLAAVLAVWLLAAFAACRLERWRAARR